MPEQGETEVILLIEDDAGIAELVSEKLEEAGQKIVHVSTGRAAISWLEHNRPRLILLDYSLPDLSGLELVEQHASVPGGIPPFIVTTGLGDEQIAVTMMKHGARDYLIKDANFLDNLQRVVEQVLKQIDTERQLAEAELELQQRNRELELLYEVGWDLSGTLELENIYATLHRFIRESMPCDTLYVSSYDANDNLIRCLYGWVEGKRLDTTNLPSVPLGSGGRGMQSQVIRSGKSLYLPDLLTEWLANTTTRYGFDENGYLIEPVVRQDGEYSRSAILAPLKFKEQVVGVINVFSNQLNDFTASDLRLLASLAFHVAAAITNATLYQQAQTEIVNAGRAEAALKESEERYRAIFEGVQDAIFVETLSGEIIDVNQRACEMFGYSREQFLVKTVADLAPAGSWAVLSDIEYATNQPEHIIETFNLRADGKRFPIELSWRMQILDGKPVMLVVMRDITERKQTEQAIRIALNEKEVLLRELYHRTKNNMQVISALLNLEAERRNEDDVLQKTLLDMDNRIRSMALVHQKLYQSRNLSSIDLKDYISDLVYLLIGSYQTTSNQINLDLDIKSVIVVIDSAIPCGLIVNEIITNSLKYAFPNGRTGKIRVRIVKMQENMILLEISDNGVGIPAGLDLRQSNSLGMQIILGIAGYQLGAQVEVDTTCGVAWRIQFSGDKYHARV